MVIYRSTGLPFLGGRMRGTCGRDSEPRLANKKTKKPIANYLRGDDARDDLYSGTVRMVFRPSLVRGLGRRRGDGGGLRRVRDGVGECQYLSRSLVGEQHPRGVAHRLTWVKPVIY